MARLARSSDALRVDGLVRQFCPVWAYRAFRTNPVLGKSLESANIRMNHLVRIGLTYKIVSGYF
jgi:hypothetical protein